MHANMTAEHKAAFKELMRLTPTNIHLLSNVNYSQRIDFESLWFRHGPNAARFFLFPSYWNGKLMLKEDARQS